MSRKLASSFTLSAGRYNRLFGEGALYRRLGRRMVLATHARLGWVRGLQSTRAAVSAGVDVLHPRKLFYAGGPQSVRGYGENQLGPRVLTIALSELQRIGCNVSDTVALITQCDPGAAHVRRDLNGVPVLENGKIIVDKLASRDFTP